MAVYDVSYLDREINSKGVMLLEEIERAHRLCRSKLKKRRSSEEDVVTSENADLPQDQSRTDGLEHAKGVKKENIPPSARLPTPNSDDDPRLIRSPQLIQTKKIKEEEEESETNTSPKDIPRISGTMLDSKYSDGGISRYYSNGHPNGLERYDNDDIGDRKPHVNNNFDDRAFPSSATSSPRYFSDNNHPMMAMSRDELIADDVPPIVRVLPDNIDEQEDVERRRMYYDNDNDEEKFSATTRMGADFEPRSNDQQHDEIKQQYPYNPYKRNRRKRIYNSSNDHQHPRYQHRRDDVMMLEAEEADTPMTSQDHYDHPDRKHYRYLRHADESSLQGVFRHAMYDNVHPTLIQSDDDVIGTLTRDRVVVLVGEESNPMLPPATIDRVLLNKYKAQHHRNRNTTGENSRDPSECSIGDVAEKVIEINVNDPYNLCSLLASDKSDDYTDNYQRGRGRPRKSSHENNVHVDQDLMTSASADDVSEGLVPSRRGKSFVSTMLPTKNNNTNNKRKDTMTMMGRGGGNGTKISVCKYSYKCSRCESWFADSVQLKKHMSTIHDGNDSGNRSSEENLSASPGSGYARSTTLATADEKSFKSVKDFIHEKIFKKAEHEKVVVCVPLKMEPPQHRYKQPHPYLVTERPRHNAAQRARVVTKTAALPQVSRSHDMEIVYHAPSPPPTATADHYHRSPVEKVYFNSCELCGLQFRSYSDLALHMGEVHSRVAPPPASSSESLVPTLKATGKSAGPNHPYKCTQCPASFGTSFNLKRHVRIHTGTRPYKCLDCHAAFITKAQLTTHQRTHTGEKPYKCHICGGKFIQQNNLKRHIMTHTGEKPFKCDKCTAAFISSSDLKRHIRVHTGEKPYKCQHCNKGFTTSGNLSSHYKMHTGEKPYKCHLCSASFSHQSNLKTHIKRHVLPFKCPCGEGWATQEELNRHVVLCKAPPGVMVIDDGTRHQSLVQ